MEGLRRRPPRAPPRLKKNNVKAARVASRGERHGFGSVGLHEVTSDLESAVEGTTSAVSVCSKS